MSIDKLSLQIHDDIDLGIQIFYKQCDSILYTAHGHSFYEIFCVTSGTATHWCNNLSSSIKKGSLIFIRPEDFHQYKDNSDDFSFYNLVISSETAEKIFSLYDKDLITTNLLNRERPPEINLSEIQTDRLAEKFLRDIETIDLKVRSLYNVEILTSILPLFIAKDIYKKDRYPLWFQELIELIEEDKNYTKGIEHLYSMATRSREHVSRNFKKYFNKTPTEYINNKKLLYSANLLRQTNIEIIDIGEMAGFNSHSHFYHQFKKKFNTSPKLYRANNSLLLEYMEFTNE